MSSKFLGILLEILGSLLITLFLFLMLSNFDIFSQVVIGILGLMLFFAGSFIYPSLAAVFLHLALLLLSLDLGFAGMVFGGLGEPGGLATLSVMILVPAVMFVTVLIRRLRFRKSMSNTAKAGTQ